MSKFCCDDACAPASTQDEEFRARPRLDIIQPLPESCEEISSDALTVRNFQDNECRDYRLGEPTKTAPDGEMPRIVFAALLISLCVDPPNVSRNAACAREL